MNGRAHATASAVSSVPAGIVVGAIAEDPRAGLWAGAGCIAGILLTPDLDQEGYSALEIEGVKALGPLGYLWLALWWPYAKAIPHRSFWSHGPLVGTLGRLLWLLLVGPALVGLAMGGGFLFWRWINKDPVSPLQAMDVVRKTYQALVPDLRQPHWFPVFLGLSVSDLLHFLMDAIPIRRPKRRRR